MKIHCITFLIVILLSGFNVNVISNNLNNDNSAINPINDSINSNPILIPELRGSFIFDGLVNDPCWDSISPLTLIMHIPTFGIKPSENSEVFICHDNVYLYVAGRFFDKEADKITIATKMRDDVGPTEDGFLAIFDTFYDHENAVGFRTNAAGVRQDLTIANDGTDDFPWNETWNTFWDVKSTRDDKGWYTEMQIPLSSLRFQEKDGFVSMGFACNRFIPRKFEIDVFPAIPRNWGFWSFVKPSQAKEIVLEGVQSKKPFYIAPYITGGINQESRLNETETEYNLQNEPKLAVGLDVKYGITSNLTADVTINTDFAQVESDNVQINLTRFSLFFPEKRMFFQERSSNFAYSFDGMNTLFYSRQIGLHEGRAVPIIGGIRLVGRAGPWDIGFLDMQTRAYKTIESDGVDLPSENFGVLRLRRQVFNKNSYVGGIVTSRMGTDGTYNEVVGLDGIIRIFGNDYLDIKYAHSFDEKYINKTGSLDASRVWFDWQRRNEKGPGYDFFYSRAGAKFLPDLGFEYRENYYMFGTKLKYGWIPGEESFILTHKIEFNAQAWKDNGTNNTQSATFGPGYSMDFKSGSGIYMNFNHAYESLTDTFFLSDDDVIAYVPPGNYNFNYASAGIYLPHTNPFFLEVVSNLGQYYDGTQFTIRFMSVIKFGSVLGFEPFYEYDRIHFPTRNQEFTGHIAGLKTMIMLNNKLSVRAQVEYSNLAHGVVTNVRLRYNPKEGNDFYFVFNEGRNIELNRESPTLNPIANRGILVKYTYTFIL